MFARCRHLYSLPQRIRVSHRATFTSKALTASLKSELLTALEANKWDATGQEVASVIQELQKVNPTANAATSPLAFGNFKQIDAINFPNQLGRDEDGNAMYTLGRVAWNVFQPIDLPVTLLNIHNIVSPAEEPGTYHYEFLINIRVSVANQLLHGVLLNQALCSPYDKKPERLNVTFRGGKLMPAEDATEQELSLWCDTFAKQSKEALPVAVRARKWVASKMFGLSDAELSDAQRGELQYTLKRSPRGYTDILYLDDEMRITQGNRKSVVIAVRQNQNE